MGAAFVAYSGIRALTRRPNRQRENLRPMAERIGFLCDADLVVPPTDVSFPYRTGRQVTPICVGILDDPMTGRWQDRLITIAHWRLARDGHDEWFTLFFMRHYGELPAFSLEPATRATRPLTSDLRLSESFRQAYHAEGDTSVLDHGLQGWLEIHQDGWHLSSQRHWILIHLGRPVPAAKLQAALENIHMLMGLLGVPV